nr:putative DUF21 domain-containing protein At3g13070, chloroplastic isoform X2 [Ziziphus jujuba var. spinosa]
MVCGDLKYDSKRPFAVEGVVNAAYDVIGQSILLLRNAWPKTLQVLWVFRNEGLILAALFGLSAFFPMAETSITNLWPSRATLLCPYDQSLSLLHFNNTFPIGTTASSSAS